MLPTDLDGHMLSVSSRLSIDKTPKLNKDDTPKLKLQEAILVGNHQNQVSFTYLIFLDFDYYYCCYNIFNISNLLFILK